MKKQTAVAKLKIAPALPMPTNKFANIAGFLLAAALIFFFCFLLQVNLVISIFLISIAVYLKFLYKDLNFKPYRLLNLGLLFLILIATSYAIIGNGSTPTLIPFAILPMLATILFNDLVLSFVISAAGAVAVASLSKNIYSLGMLFLITAVVASLLVYGARRRNTIVNAGIIIGLVQALALFFIRQFSLQDTWQYLFVFLTGLASGVIVAGILPVFEYLFGTITNIKLLELADFNNPLLNRLMIEAPGTYHHSLIVGNLSEGAAKAVGVNSLLARIGAYYHDIGKLQKPDYFSENQTIHANVHETLAPNMSKLVIMNHVKEGVELAKKYRLNHQLIDFIEQHHGNSLVYFFYRRALENSAEEEKVAEDGFRYPGPKPKTKETAIVLLADSVEAACRALKDPDPQKIEELVHKIINNKFIDTQLDECDLTLKDLEIIASVFVHILSGIYHSRIVYPEEKSGAR